MGAEPKIFYLFSTLPFLSKIVKTRETNEIERAKNVPKTRRPL